jgi:hypothetical protein
MTQHISGDTLSQCTSAKLHTLILSADYTLSAVKATGALPHSLPKSTTVDLIINAKHFQPGPLFKILAHPVF